MLQTVFTERGQSVKDRFHAASARQDIVKTRLGIPIDLNQFAVFQQLLPAGSCSSYQYGLGTDDAGFGISGIGSFQLEKQRLHFTIGVLIACPLRAGKSFPKPDFRLIAPP
jgi:hypothetical protein